MRSNYVIPPSIKVIMTEVYGMDGDEPLFVAVEDVVFSGDWPKGTNFEAISNGIKKAVRDGMKGTNR